MQRFELEENQQAVEVGQVVLRLRHHTIASPYNWVLIQLCVVILLRVIQLRHDTRKLE